MLLHEHLDLQLHVDVMSIFGGGIPASILNHTAAVTELLPMPPSEADGESLSSQGESGGGGEGRRPSSRAPRRGTGSSAGPAGGGNSA